MRVGVVGHVESVEFIRVGRIALPGEIVHATDAWVEAAGGGSVSVVQLAKLAGQASLFTALGDDATGRAVPDRLKSHGVEVHAAWRNERMRRGITTIDAHAERTITIIGKRHQPAIDDPLPWHDLDAMDAVYFTAGSAEVLRRARGARVLVATSRVLSLLEEADVELDAIVRSARDPSEPDPGLRARARYVVATEGEKGGFFREANGRTARWSPAPLPGPAVDAYGCGDSFAAGLTFALGEGQSIAEACAFAARCGAACLSGRAPFGGQLTAKDR